MVSWNSIISRQGELIAALKQDYRETDRVAG